MPNNKRVWKRPLLVFLIYSACALAMYLHTLSYEFSFDDFRNIINNTTLNLEQLDAGSLSESLQGPTRRPLAYLTFSLNHYLSGNAVWSYRLVNIALHVLNALLVYTFALMTFNLLGQVSFTAAPVVGDHRECNDPTDATSMQRSCFPSRSSHHRLAFFAGLLWLAHPIQIQAVTYVVQRMVSLSCLFYLSGMCLYIYGRQTPLKAERVTAFALLPVCWILGLASKEIAATLPLAILLYEFYFFRQLDLTELRRQAPKLLILLLVFGIAALFLLRGNPVAYILRGYGQRDFTLGQRLLTQPRVIVFYLSLLALPLRSRLCLDHHFPASTSLFSPMSTLFSLIILAGLLATGILLARRKRLLSFAILWFFLHLAIESSFMGLEMAFEHRLYLPSVCLAMVLALALDRLVPPRPLWQWGLPLILIALLGGITWQRNLDWKDALTIWRDCAQKAPRKVRTHFNLAYHYEQLGQFDLALAEYTRALSLPPDRLLPRVLNSRGRLKQKLKDYPGAWADYENCRQCLPTYPALFESRGNWYSEQGMYKKALTEFNQALKLAPNSSSIRHSRGLCYRKMGQTKLALADFAAALKSNSFPDLFYNRGLCYFELGQYQQAIEDFSASLTVKPDRADAFINRGACLLRLGQLAAAIADLTQGIRLDPKNPGPYYNRALAYAATGNLPQAQADIAQCRQLGGDTTELEKILNPDSAMEEKHRRD
jgi:tetratricopeptide (TPR) repeat protein